jgi:hypothetical protein
MNALNALGNLRQKKGISEAMKRCSCEGQRNLDYLTCHTSLASFISAVSYHQVDYPTLSGNGGGPSIDIKKQEENIRASNAAMRPSWELTG